MDKSLIPVLSFNTEILAGSIGASSQETYKRQFLQYLQFAGSPEAALLPSTLARWRAYLSRQDTTLSPNTINNKLAAVRSIMEAAAAQAFISHELAEEFQRVKGVKPAALKHNLKTNTRATITDSEVAALLEAPGRVDLIDYRDTAIMHTAFSSGLRAAEMATLQISQIREENGGYLLSIRGKGAVQYEDAPLSRLAYDAIQEWLEKRKEVVTSPYIFTAFDGPKKPASRHISEAGLWKLVKKYSQKKYIHSSSLEEKNISTHSIRRDVGTRVVKKYGIEKGREVLRHKSIKTTDDHYNLSKLEAGLTDNLR